MPLERQTTIDKQVSQPGIRRSAELVVPADVNCLVLHFMPDPALWSTSGVMLIYGIERLVKDAWQHVTSAYVVTTGKTPTDRAGNPINDIFLRDGTLEADKSPWAGETVRAFCLISEQIDYKLELEGQALTEQDLAERRL